MGYDTFRTYRATIPSKFVSYLASSGVLHYWYLILKWAQLQIRNQQLSVTSPGISF